MCTPIGDMCKLVLLHQRSDLKKKKKGVDWVVPVWRSVGGPQVNTSEQELALLLLPGRVHFLFLSSLLLQPLVCLEVTSFVGFCSVF